MYQDQSCMYHGNILEEFEFPEQKKTSYPQFFTKESEEKPILFVLHICGLLVGEGEI